MEITEDKVNVKGIAADKAQKHTTGKTSKSSVFTFKTAFIMIDWHFLLTCLLCTIFADLFSEEKLLPVQHWRSGLEMIFQSLEVILLLHKNLKIWCLHWKRPAVLNQQGLTRRASNSMY